MHKKTTKSHRLTNKRTINKLEPRSARMTILQKQRLINHTSNGNGIDNDDLLICSTRANSRSKSRSSSSWDNQKHQQTNDGSWSEDVEDAASLRILAHWSIVERTLCDEEDQLPPGQLFDECVQWRNQIPHLRIVGRSSNEKLENGNGKSNGINSKVSSALRRRELSPQTNDKGDELLSFERDFFSREPSFHSSNHQSLRQAKEQVLDYIVEFICKELAEIQAEKEAEQQLSDDFDEFLKITAAPTTTGKNPLASNNFYHNVESTKTSTKKDKVKDKDKVEVKEMNLQIGRNKLGTVFNERIIVSPVPFVVTTRESFSTIRRTPIQFIAENLDLPNNIHSGSRRENTRRKLSLTRKTPLITAPHVQPSWNTPVCPTIWPKNVKLTPIDTSRLPSSKRRPSKTADSIPLRRNRNSLSPISRSVQPSSPRLCDTPHEGLEICGSHITVNKSAKAKLPRVKRIES